MKQKVTTFLKKATKSWLLGVAAGMCIGMGTITYLLISNKLLGAFIFALGLFLVCTYRLKLCTGMAGYLSDERKSKTEGFVVASIGNIHGITIMYLLSLYWNPAVDVASRAVLETKFMLQPWQAFISALFCGMLMFLAVDIYNEAKDTLSCILGIFLAVPCFIINGFDHCVVTMFYIHSSRTLPEVVHGLQLFSTVMIGNFIGALLAWFLFYKLRKWNTDK